MPGTPHEIRELDRDEIVALLRRHHVGRIAYSLHDRVDIEPISYIYDDGWIFGRTSAGTKLTVLSRRPWVAFEVDEVTSPLEWKSVVLHGAFLHLSDEGNESDRLRFERGLDAIKLIMPEAFDEDDPHAFRDVLFGIQIDRMSGRSSSAVRAGS